MDSIFSKKTFSFLLVSFTLLSLQPIFAQGCDETTFTDFLRLGYAGNPFNENFISKQKGDKIYAIKTGNTAFLIQSIGEFDTLWVYNIKTRSISFFKVSSQNMKRKYKNDTGKDFYISNDGKLYVLTYRSIHIYSENDTGFSFYKSIKPKFSYSYILGEIEKFLILYEGYNYHPLDQREKVIISKFSTKSNEIVKSIYPKMLGVELTHSNKRFCDIHNNTILFAQPFSDTICIYNSELERIGNIKLKHKVDSTIKLNYKEYSTDQIQKLLMEDYLYKRNIKIDVFGDTLLVLFKKKFQNFRGSVWFDVYTHKNNTWQLTDTSKYISFTFDSTKQVTPTTTYVPYIIDNNQIIVYDGNMYELINKHIEIRNPISYKEYNNLVDVAFYENTFKVALQKQPLKCLFNP
jgi:hypothetical protein